jgi:hypothetical protein
MESAGSNNTVANDVLHLGAQSKLSPEEIAKAIAHHNRHHGSGQPQSATATAGGGKKQPGRKAGK